MIPLSQRDPRWKDIKLGFSDTTIGNYGCVITCIAILADLTPDDVNERLKNVNGYYNKNLIIWEKVTEAIPNLKFVKRIREYNNEDVSNNLPCLVEVDATRIGAAKHWVVYIGNQQMLDPWYGNQKSTNYYAPLGYSVIKQIETNMPDKLDWLKTIMQEWGVNLESEPRARERLGEIYEGFNKKLELEEKIKKLEKSLEGSVAETAVWEARFQAIEKRRTELEAEIAEKNRIISEKETTLFQMGKELEGFEGKVVLDEETYQKLSSKECLARFSIWQHIRYKLRKK